MKALALSLLLLAPAAPALAQEEYKFDISEFKKKPYEFGGYAELRQEHLWLNRDGALYQINAVDQPQRSSLDRTTATLELAGKYQRDTLLFRFRTHSSYQHDQLEDENVNRLYEGFVSWRPDPGFTGDVGKQALLWGKGYAFNPAGFLQRPKDPLEPELAREGFTLLAADWIRSSTGPLQTVSFTPLLLPVTGDMNSDFGEPGHPNPAARLYMLYRNIDIDLMYLAPGSRSPRIGADFSTNIRTNLEIHGEAAYVWDAATPVVDSTGTVTTREDNAASYLFGVRYLTESETTYIIEYYHNGPGHTETEMQDFAALADRGVTQYQSSGSDMLLRRAATVSRSFSGFAPMRDYLYARITGKDSFGILYFAPGLTTIINLNDGSYNFTPELMYTAVKNLTLRLRAGFLQGDAGTEYGEKQNERRVELMARYYF